MNVRHAIVLLSTYIVLNLLRLLVIGSGQSLARWASEVLQQ